MSVSPFQNFFVDTIQGFSGAETEQQVLDALARELRKLGYDRYYLAHARRFSHGGGLALATHSTFRRSFLEEVVRERMHEADLLVDHCWKSDRPLLWSSVQQSLADASLNEAYRRTIRFTIDHRYFAGVTVATHHRKDVHGESFWSISLIQSAGFSATEHDRCFPRISERLEVLLNALVARLDEDLFIKAHFELDAVDRECILRILDGAHVQQIADDLKLADRTVAYHLAKMRRKLHARNNAHAVAVALLMGLV